LRTYEAAEVELAKVHQEIRTKMLCWWWFVGCLQLIS